MKATIKIFVILFVTLSGIFSAQAQCTTGCTNTINASSASASYWWITSGTYCIPAGVNFTGTMVMASGSTLNICGKFTGTLSIQGGTVNNYGTLAPSVINTMYTGTLNNYDSFYYAQTLSVSGSFNMNNYSRMRFGNNLSFSGSNFLQDGKTLTVAGNLDINSSSKLTITSGDSVLVGGNLELSSSILVNGGYLRVNGNTRVNSGSNFTNNKTLSVGTNLEVNATFKSTDSVYVNGATKNNSGGSFQMSGKLYSTYLYNNSNFIADNATIQLDSLLSNNSSTLTLKNGGSLYTKNFENYATITSAGTGSPKIRISGNSINTGTLSGNLDFCDASGTGSPDNNGGAVGSSVKFCNNSLPVTWSEFSVRWTAPNTGILNWTTTMEINNNYFIIYRSENGTDWTAVGEVKGNGTTSQSSHYTFEDAFLSLSSKVCYYKIKQVDFDNQFAFSSVVKMDKGAQAAQLITFANPATSELNINFQAPVKGQVSVSIMDMSGRVVMNYQTGSELTLGNYSISIADLPAGIYSMNLASGQESLLSAKLMIQ